MFLFVLRTFNDVDHITPLIWHCIQKGHKPVIVFHSTHDYKNDYRIQFLEKTGQVEIIPDIDHEFEKRSIQLGSQKRRNLIERSQTKWYYQKRKPHSPIGKWYRKTSFDCTRQIDLIKAKNIKAVVMEWHGSPYVRGDVIEKYFKAAKGLGLPIFSIPHGCNIYLNSDVHDVYTKNIAKGILPEMSGRDAFDVNVVQSRFHVKHMVRFGASPIKTQAWGSLRFSPEWQKINLDICPSFKTEKESGDRLKVVFMLPHWNYNVDKQKTLSLIDKIADDEAIHLVIKDHTRGDVGLLPVSYQDKFAKSKNVEVCVEAHSPALINWSDVTINFGSSIGIEALLQDKILLHPAYLHTNDTIFDRTRAALIAHSEKDAIDHLIACKTGSPSIPKENIDAIYRSIIFGGEDPHNVLDGYYDKMVELVERI